ncbi:MAG: hypothetical protein KatS3mg118_0203 [Paracoccaceae bacterium]|nr:MAG: hypothetical protein KatS3mg118_0203 [Paracoccaceae bacterium]
MAEGEQRRDAAALQGPGRDESRSSSGRRRSTRRARTLLQVRIEHAAEADEIFTKLMGDVVEPRRQFIQENALSVDNLDI